jgi:hypothetical protein
MTVIGCRGGSVPRHDGHCAGSQQPRWRQRRRDLERIASTWTRESARAGLAALGLPVPPHQAFIEDRRGASAIIGTV